MAVRYIKLGRGGDWEKDCLTNGTLRLGFWTGLDAMFAACVRRDEVGVMRELGRMRNKQPGDSVRNDLRQVQSVFWDDGSTVWITFHNRRMYWGRLDTDRTPQALPDGSSLHFMAEPGWRDHTDTVEKRPLLKDDLAGHLGMVTQYQGTICTPKDEEYVLRRIRGDISESARKAKDAIDDLEARIAKMLTELTPGDFETIVEMAFSAAGWRREGVVGRTEEDVDIVLVRSSIGGAPDPLTDGAEERVAVQVKSDANAKVFEHSVARLRDSYARAMFVFHSGSVGTARYANVEVVDAKRLASMVLDAGLTRWLLRRVR